MQDYDQICFRLSEQVTKSYSTSFFSATRMLDKESRLAIFSIYGFVRLADEIVDTFHDFDKKNLLEKFEADYYAALEQGISLNPVLHSFQQTIRRYGIPVDFVRAFLSSMKADLQKTVYETKAEIDRYVFGSADVVGLMCLKVFCKGDEKLYQELEAPAMRLGSAFQNVNFLRDMKNDFGLLNRSYFPGIKLTDLDEAKKQQIVEEIEGDFSAALSGIRKLPGRAKLAVMTAYLYYLELLKKIKKSPASRIAETRIRVADSSKLILLVKAFVYYKLGLI